MAIRDGGGVSSPILPPGAAMELPGRGTTFVRHVDGPARRAHARAAARLDRHRRPQLVHLLPPARPPLPGDRDRPSRSRAWHPLEEAVPPRGLRRRRRRRLRRARHRAVHPGRLLDGRPDRPAHLAPPPRACRADSCCAPRAATSSTSREERLGFLGLSGLAAARPAHPGAGAPLAHRPALPAAQDRAVGAVGGAGGERCTTGGWCSRPGKAIGSFSSRPWIGEVDVPTSVVITMRDRVVPVRRQVRLFESIQGAEAFRVDGDHDAVVAERRPVRAHAAARRHSVIERAELRTPAPIA